MIDHAVNWAIAACDEHAAMQEFGLPKHIIFFFEGACLCAVYLCSLFVSC